MDVADARIGLCASCCFHRAVEGARSTFHLCERSRTDPRYPKYPRLPVLACAGYVENRPETSRFTESQ